MIKMLLVGLMFLVNIAYASEFQFGYSATNGSHVGVYKNVIPFKWKELDITPSQKYVDSKEGSVINLVMEVKKDFQNKWDLFSALDYTNDEVLLISDRLDYKVGFGYDLLSDSSNLHKISYALVYRSGDLLNSFRYKYVHSGIFYNTKTVIYVITPTEEVSADFSTDFRIYSGASFSVNNSYKFLNNNMSYVSTAGIKLIY